MVSKKVEKVMLIGLSLACTFLIAMFFNWTYINGFGQDIKDLNFIYYSENTYVQEDFKEFFPSHDLNMFNSKYDNFLEYVNLIYEYNEVKDCKYWTYVYYSYFRINYPELEFDFITTQNHVFGMLSNTNGYCIYDLNNQNCFGEIVEELK